MRNVLINSFEGKINDVLFAQLVILGVCCPHPLAETGRVTLKRDPEYLEVLSHVQSTNVASKFDFLSKMRFKL